MKPALTLLAALLLVSPAFPGLAATQDLSTREKRAAWLIEQYRGESINPNAKHGAARALARLALNPNDAEVIDRITRFYDKLPAGKNGNQFNYSGVAMVLGKYWDKFTPAQRDHLKARLKGFDDLTKHGTENHAIMKNVAAYLFAQYWPHENGRLRGKITSAELGETARTNLLNVMRSLYEKGYAENLSTTYAATHLFPYYALYSCAMDPGMRAAADAALHFHVANLAANQIEGVVIPPYNRQNVWQTNTGDSDSGVQWISWLYWGEKQNRDPVGVNVVRDLKANGWIFLREGDVYIAIRPLKDYTIDANYKPAGEFDVVRSAFAQTGFVFDIATKQEFATFEAFQSAVGKTPPVVDWNRLSVTCRNVRGDTITATWNPPKYEMPKAEVTDPKAKRILVRPDVTVNGAVVPIDSDFINGRAVIKSLCVELTGRVLRLQTPAGRLEVDWRGERPIITLR